MKIDEVQSTTLSWLEANQKREDGEDHVCGEFPMLLRCPEPRTDYNFLTGYALLHLAICERLLANHLGAPELAVIDRILERARDVPATYQTKRGSTNWYHGKLSGDHLPPVFQWPDNRRLSLHDDLDDTAICAILRSLRPSFNLCQEISPNIFTRWVYNPDRHKLRAKAQQRLDLVGVPQDVFMTWVIEPENSANDGSTSSLKIPLENSVELVTAANILTAIANICMARQSVYGTPENLPGNVETQRFVNRLASLAVDKLLIEDNPAFLEFCAPYYPRAPFAPLAFLLRAHVLSKRGILSNDVLQKIARAVQTVDPSRHARPAQYATFAARAHWLNAAGWCAWMHLLPLDWLASHGGRELENLVLTDFDSTAGSWPDFVFFLAAHLGDYSGPAYSNSLMVETMTLLGAVKAK